MKKCSYIARIIGICSLVCGLSALVLESFAPSWLWHDGTPKGVVYGILSATVALVTLHFTSHTYYKKHLQQAKQAKINETDERNVAIRNQAAYYMWLVSLVSISILSLVFVLMDNQVATALTLVLLGIHVIAYFFILHWVSRRFF